MTLLYIRSTGGESAAELAARTVLEAQGYVLGAGVESGAVTDANVAASTGVVVGVEASSAALIALASLGGTGGPDRPLFTMTRTIGAHVGLADSSSQAAGVSSIFLRTEGVTPLAGGSSGTKTVVTASSVLGYLQGTVAVGAVLYSQRTNAIATQFHHLVVPQGAALVAGNAQHAVGYATWLSTTDVTKANATLEQYLWRTAFQVLGDPATHVGGATISLAVGSGNRVTVPGRTVTFTATASASDASAVTVAWTANGGTFSAATGTSTVWTPPASAGTYTVTATASSTTASNVTATTSVTVLQGAQTLTTTDSAATAGATVTGAATAHAATADTNDASYVALTSVGAKVALKLSTVSDPQSSTGYGFWVDLLYASGATAATATVELVESTGTAASVRDDGGTVRATRTVTAASRPTSHPVTLSAAEADGVVNHAALWLRVAVATLGA